jgi:hypothetical protein
LPSNSWMICWLVIASSIERANYPNFTLGKIRYILICSLIVSYFSRSISQSSELLQSHR